MTCLNVKSHRLAININLLSDNLTKREISEFAKTYINVETFYKEKEVFEFNLMYNSISRIKMNHDELLNTIRSMQVVNNGVENRMITLIDLNTSQSDNRLRFSSLSIKAFVKQTKQLIIDLCGFENGNANK